MYFIACVHMWYLLILDGARVLDVGVGTATALVRNKELLLRKKITVVGVDYDADYIAKANKVRAV